jgi:peptide/nickel transport system substrate-binding protein
MRKGLTSTVAFGLASALMLAGCGSGGDSGGGGNGNGGGVLTVGAAQGIGKLNPAESGTAWELVLFPLLYDGLVKIGEKGDLEPDLATKWTSSKDLKSWTFDLRQGVKFSNGKTLTAQDVVDTFKYYMNPDTPTQFKNNLAPITGVKADSDSKVTFSLKGANALFPTTIDSIKILDMDSMDSIEKAPVVTGPYKVEKFVANDTLTLVRNPQYFGKKQGSDEIDLVTASDSSAAITGLQSGDLNSVWSVPLSQVKTLEANSDFGIVKPDVIGQYVSWEVDTTSPPFDDVRARQALAYAIDRDAILKNAYYGVGTTSDTNNPIADNSEYFGGNLTDYSYNLDKAKELFNEAGIKSGSTLTWYGVSNQYPEWNTSAQILQASLAKIGIKLDIKNVDIASWPEKFYPAGKKFPNMIIPNFQSYQPVPSDLFQFLRNGRCECNWNNAQFDSLYDKALATDDAGRNAVWAKMQELVNTDVPILVPVQFATVTATGAGVTGVWVDGTGTPHYEAAVAQ